MVAHTYVLKMEAKGSSTIRQFSPTLHGVISQHSSRVMLTRREVSECGNKKAQFIVIFNSIHSEIKLQVIYKLLELLRDDFGLNMVSLRGRSILYHPGLGLCFYPPSANHLHNTAPHTQSISCIHTFILCA